MTGTTRREERPVRGKTASWLSEMFKLDPAGINWPRAVMVLDVMLVPLVVFWAIGHEEYLLSAIFGVLFTALADPGGSYRYRVAGLAVMFGVHRFVAAYLINIWFIIALTVASGLHHAAQNASYTWAQVLARAGVGAVDRAALRFWNYALYCGIIAAAVLTLLDLPQPSSYAAEGYRILWTLCGVAVGVLVMLLAGLLARRTAKAPPRPTAQPA